MAETNKTDIAVKEMCDKEGAEVILKKIENLECEKHGKDCSPHSIEFNTWQKNQTTGRVELVPIMAGITLNGCDTLRKQVAKELGLD